MSLKINILLVLSLFLWIPEAFSEDKFLRVKGNLIDEVSKEPLSDFSIKIIEDEYDSTVFNFEKTDFDIWIPANHTSTVHFIKVGYVICHMFVDASFIPSIAYKKKQKIEDLTVKMYKKKGSRSRIKEPVFKAEYVAKLNAFEVKDMTIKKNQRISAKYQPPFPSPADTYINVKPGNNRLPLTTEFNSSKMKGNSGISRVLQGIIFADLNYCLFNERTNDANKYLKKLQEADSETWGNIKVFDSPEYGRIVSKTVNREQSVDTLFALGAYIETSRLIFQDFTADNKVLVHLKTLIKVLNQFEATAASPEVVNVMDMLNESKPYINTLESKYRDQLRNKLNFEIKEEDSFKSVQSKLQEIYELVIR